MKKMSKKTWIIIIVIMMFIAIPTAYGYYFSGYESSIISKFLINSNLNTAYVRATIVTYWVDSKTCEDESDIKTCAINAKSSWNIKDSAINSEWILLSDGYYYYKTTIDGNIINKENISNSDIALLDENLTIEDLAEDEIAITDIIPQYEIVYEIIEGSDNSTIQAWGVSYESGTPIKQ